MIAVRDDWYPSYNIHGKLYVKAELTCWQDVHDENGKRYKYGVQIVFYGADDTGMEKCMYTDDEQEAVFFYRKFKKFLRRLKKMHHLDLKTFLLNNGFQYW
jgi:hypothetical protein